MNLLIDRREDWKDKVHVLGVTLDDTADDARKAIKKQELYAWQAVMSVEDEKSEPAGSWESPAAKAFGIRGIPNYYIIGRDGKIAGCESCGETDTEKAIERVLAESK